MAHHGSRKYQRNWINYRPQDLKLIDRMWQELLGRSFRPDPRVPLDELVRIEVGDHSYHQAGEIIRKHFVEMTLHYVSKSGHVFQIPRDLRSLVVLALTQSNYSYSMERDRIYVPALSDGLPKQ